MDLPGGCGFFRDDAPYVTTFFCPADRAPEGEAMVSGAATWMQVQHGLGGGCEVLYFRCLSRASGSGWNAIHLAPENGRLRHVAYARDSSLALINMPPDNIVLPAY